MSQFLLPCDCGAKIPVNRSQAGMSLPCPHCGKSIDVPTIRKLAAFANAAPVQKETKTNSSWKFLGPVAALGFLVGLVGLAYGGSLLYERYSTISQVTRAGMDLNRTEEEFIVGVRENALKSAPADTWDYWNVMLEEGLSDPKPPDLVRVKRYLASLLPTTIASLITGGVGVLVFGISAYFMQVLRRTKR